MNYERGRNLFRSTATADGMQAAPSDVNVRAAQSQWHCHQLRHLDPGIARTSRAFVGCVPVNQPAAAEQAAPISDAIPSLRIAHEPILFNTLEVCVLTQVDDKLAFPN